MHRRTFRLLCVVGMLVFLVALIRSSVDAYPVRPIGVRTYVMRGTLVDYGLGTRGGGLTTVTADGRSRTAVIAYPNTIDGHHYLCQDLPSLRDPAPSAVACSQRPPGILVGRSHVHVTYWYGMVSGRRVKISDAIVSERTRGRR